MEHKEEKQNQDFPNNPSTISHVTDEEMSHADNSSNDSSSSDE
jgi:hypothetical protein